MDTFEYLKSIDLGTFLDFPTAFPSRDQPLVKIQEDGRIFLYGELRKRLAEKQSDYCARISPDGRYVALYPQRTPNVHFNMSGSSVRNERLLKFLQEKEIQMPAVYTMEWFEQEQAWVGCCEELPEPDLATIRKNVKKASKGRAR